MDPPPVQTELVLSNIENALDFFPSFFASMFASLFVFFAVDQLQRKESKRTNQGKNG